MIREWHPGDREDRHHDPARSAAALFGAASLVTAIGLLLPHVPQVDEGGLVFVSVAAGAVALALMLVRHRIPIGLYPFVALTGTVLVSLSLYFNGERHGGPAGGDEMYFLWIVLWAAFHLRRRALAVQVGAILVAYGLTLHAIDPGGSAMSRWITLSGLVVGAAVVVRLLSERIEALISELRANASTDPLTGLANRRGLAAAYARELAQHQRSGRPFSLLVADLDRFKQINDELGHKAGDRALVEIAGLLRAQVRAVDTRGAHRRRRVRAAALRGRRRARGAGRRAPRRGRARARDARALAGHDQHRRQRLDDRRREPRRSAAARRLAPVPGEAALGAHACRARRRRLTHPAPRSLSATGAVRGGSRCASPPARRRCSRPAPGS